MEQHGDDLRYVGLRKALIGHLRQKNIRDRAVLQAIGSIPRHLFMPKGLEKIAYEDRAIPIGSEQTISQPYTVAFQTELLAVEQGQKILEIGTGSGYQAAVLSFVGAQVYTIERQTELFEILSAPQHPIHRYAHIQRFFGDGYVGLEAHAPFDKVLLTAASKEIPSTLFRQLKVGGSMLLPLGDFRTSQVMTRITKQSEEEYTTEQFGQFLFVPMLGGTH